MKKLLALVIAFGGLVAFTAPAHAGHDESPSSRVALYTYSVNPVPHPGTDSNAAVTGTVRFKALPNNKVQVKVRLSGLTPNQPHAQHIHGALTGGNVCPGPELAGSDIVNGTVVAGNRFIATLDAAPAYGGIQVSLTTSGDTSPASALAVDRFPVADSKGNLTYNRTITVSEAVHDNLGVFHFVTHGIDLDGSGGYDGAPSPLSSALPFEGTIPAGCGGNN